MREGKKWSTIKVEGRPIEVRITDSSTNGAFFAVVDHKRYSAHNLADLTSDIRKDLKENEDLDFKPIIAINNHSKERCFHDKGVIFGIDYYRFFRAEHPFKGTIYKLFESVDREGFSVGEDGTEGMPGRDTNAYEATRDSTIIIDYTPQRWLALVNIKKQYLDLKNRVEELLSEGDVQNMLEQIFIRLIEAPKEGKNEK